MRRSIIPLLTMLALGCAPDTPLGGDGDSTGTDTTGDGDGDPTGDGDGDPTGDGDGDPTGDGDGDGDGDCGNGVVDPGEGCDDGNAMNDDACPDGLGGTCQLAACGDAHVYTAIEECDDGNTMSGDGCDQNCMWEGTCGDGMQTQGEECDLGGANDDEASGACPDVCRVNCLCPHCGDGVPDFDAGETCDDGNTGSGDGCSSMCIVEAPDTCGDGVVDIPDEECDDNNTNGGDGCDASCQFEALGANCGDGVVDPGEVCDDNNTLNGDGCNPTCNLLTQVTDLAPIPNAVIATDGTYLYTSDPNTCQIVRTSIATCSGGNCPWTPIVGTSCTGQPVDGPGASAELGTAFAIAGFGVGEGKLFFGDVHTLRQVDLQSPNLDVTTLAGSQNACGQQNGIGNAAVMADIRDLVYYAGLVYFVDANMGTLRTLDPGTGEVLTVAGQAENDNSGSNFDCNQNLCCGNMGQAMDGYGTNSKMRSPRYITSDNSGFIYINDTNGNAFRRYNVATTYLSTIVSGNGYNDGVGGQVGMDRPRGLTSDGTSVYFAEQNEWTVRQLEFAASEMTTLIGVRGCGGPANLMGGVGGDGTQNWGGNCNAMAVANKPQLQTGAAGLAYDANSGTIFVATSQGRLLKVE